MFKKFLYYFFFIIVFENKNLKAIVEDAETTDTSNKTTTTTTTKTTATDDLKKEKNKATLKIMELKKIGNLSKKENEYLDATLLEIKKSDSVAKVQKLQKEAVESVEVSKLGSKNNKKDNKNKEKKEAAILANSEKNKKDKEKENKKKKEEEIALISAKEKNEKKNNKNKKIEEIALAKKEADNKNKKEKDEKKNNKNKKIEEIALAKKEADIKNKKEKDEKKKNTEKNLKEKEKIEKKEIFNIKKEFKNQEERLKKKGVKVINILKGESKKNLEILKKAQDGIFGHLIQVSTTADFANLIKGAKSSFNISSCILLNSYNPSTSDSMNSEGKQLISLEKAIFEDNIKEILKKYRIIVVFANTVPEYYDPNYGKKGGNRYNDPSAIRTNYFQISDNTSNHTAAFVGPVITDKIMGNVQLTTSQNAYNNGNYNNEANLNTLILNGLNKFVADNKITPNKTS